MSEEVVESLAANSNKAKRRKKVKKVILPDRDDDERKKSSEEAVESLSVISNKAKRRKKVEKVILPDGDDDEREKSSEEAVESIAAISKKVKKVILPDRDDDERKKSSEEAVESIAAISKKAKRRKKVKKVGLPDRDDLERKKLLASINHKKTAISTNWQSFVTKQMHIDPDVQKKSHYTGVFRQNRKARIGAVTEPALKNDQQVGVEEHSPSTSIVPKLTTTYKDNMNSDVKLTKWVAMDCEMVGVDYGGKDDMVARVSLVNKHGDCIYDKFVKPKEEVVDYRTHVSGVRASDLTNGESFETVQKEVSDIITGRILVGHALRNDLKVLFLSHPRRKIRDTSKYKKFRQLYNGRTPSLKKLTASILGVTIQEGEHSSVTDARAAMQLYLMYQKEWESQRRRKPMPVTKP